MSADFDTTLRAIFSESGLDNPEGSLHGWRCAHPDRFPGYCHCVDDLVTDVKEAHERALAERTTANCDEKACAVAQAAKPRVLTADDPEPAVGSVALDPHGNAWKRGPGGWHRSGLSGVWNWPFAMLFPLRLIHDGGQ